MLINYFTGLKQNITLTSNQRLEIKIGEHNLEVLISSKDMFGVFGSNNPKTVASIVRIWTKNAFTAASGSRARII